MRSPGTADVRRRLALSAGSQTPCRRDSGTNLPGAERRSPHAVSALGPAVRRGAGISRTEHDDAHRRCGVRTGRGENAREERARRPSSRVSLPAELPSRLPPRPGVSRPRLGERPAELWPGERRGGRLDPLSRGARREQRLDECDGPDGPLDDPHGGPCGQHDGTFSSPCERLFDVLNLRPCVPPHVNDGESSTSGRRTRSAVNRGENHGISWCRMTVRAIS